MEDACETKPPATLAFAYQRMSDAAQTFIDLSLFVTTHDPLISRLEILQLGAAVGRIATIMNTLNAHREKDAKK